MLAVFSEARGVVVQKAIFTLGDRVQIYASDLYDNQLTVTVIEAGPTDAMCCPTQMTRKTLRLENDELVEKDSTVLGFLSFETLAGSRWTLHPENEDQPPEGTTVNIKFSNQLISGNAGCNRFKTIVSQGAENTALSTGQVALTRRYCNAPLDVWEKRFSELLGSATRFQFLLGDLLLIGESGRLRLRRA
ncbi:conserved domain protein [Luminiphilus syltensis NOR5-1B]|uniref:Conserved domain protein n=2 Tax=Luminiphilus TaxID=1341118 RepID=B8KWQ7_9GAMM|nr:conserved domain protein [Luminiphilus syltensis NOR5-1B]